jgi:LPXTG-site transpeptidase (sortase) family protein
MRLWRLLICLFLTLAAFSFPPPGAVVAKSNSVSVQAKLSILVTKTADTNDGSCSLLDCSLREAVIAAQAAPGSVIYVPAATYSLTRTGADENNSDSGDLDIKVDTTIIGQADSHIDGVASDRIFHVQGGKLALEELVLENGRALTGAAVRVEAGAALALQLTSLSSNHADLYGGGIYVGSGAALTVESSTLNGNFAGQDGGGVYNLGGTVYIVNSTLSGNRANRHGGGVYHYGPGRILGLYSSTLFGNIADVDSNGDGWGGGLYQDQITSQVNLANTLIAGNISRSGSAPDCQGILNSADYNLIQTTNGYVMQGVTTHNLSGQNPLLDPLANNGGVGMTHRLGLNSPALDAANPAGCVNQLGGQLLGDQRGESRSVDGNGDGTARCDIGAYEREEMLPATVSQISHTLSGSSQAHTTGSQLTIGELVDLHAVVTFPAGQAQNATLTVTLGPGLAWVNCHNLSASGMETSYAGGFPAVCAAPEVRTYPAGSLDPTDAGRQAVLSLGNLSNRSGGDLLLALTYTAAVLNVPANIQGTQLAATLTWSAEGQSLDSSSEILTVVEPLYTVMLNPYPGLVEYLEEVQVNVSAEPAAGRPVGFDLALTVPIPVDLQYESGSFAWEGGLAPTMLQTALPLAAHWDTLVGLSQLSYRAQLQEKIDPFHPMQMKAGLSWSSLPGMVNTSLSAFNSYALERTYIPGDPLNNYYFEGSGQIGAPAELPKTGFAPFKHTVTDDSTLKVDLNGDMTLEIPRLNVTMPILNVPLSAGGWDLTWLGSAAGHLEGTAFPTWEGNSVVTGHAYLSNGFPGPFAFLDGLRWDDRLIVHAFGQDYIYAVREVTQVLPDDLSPLRHEELPWLTLVSCRGYDAETNTYLWRTVVRAVLIEIK